MASQLSVQYREWASLLRMSRKLQLVAICISVAFALHQRPQEGYVIIFTTALTLVPLIIHLVMTSVWAP